MATGTFNTSVCWYKEIQKLVGCRCSWLDFMHALVHVARLPVRGLMQARLQGQAGCGEVVRGNVGSRNFGNSSCVLADANEHKKLLFGLLNEVQLLTY